MDGRVLIRRINLRQAPQPSRKIELAQILVPGVAIAMVDILCTVHKIAQTLRRRWDSEIRKHIPGMNAMRATALVRLAQTDGTSQEQLARVLEVSHMSVTRFVDDLEQLGWAQRRSDPADRRT